MACLLYCVALAESDSVLNLTGVAEQPVVVHDSGGVCVHWSEVANPETLLDRATRKAAEGKFRQVLREIVAVATPIAFPFPAMVADLDGLDAMLAERRDVYAEALRRLDGTVQYELTATWEDEDRADLATPVSGRDYLKRRQQAADRIAAIDTKLKSVTAGIVREWRLGRDRRKHLWYALVPRSDRERFIAALRSAGPSEGVRLKLSGPWPPSEFLRADESQD